MVPDDGHMFSICLELAKDGHMTILNYKEAGKQSLFQWLCTKLKMGKGILLLLDNERLFEKI